MPDICQTTYHVCISRYGGLVGLISLTGLAGVGVTDGHVLHHRAAMCPVRGSMCGADGNMHLKRISNTGHSQVNHFLSHSRGLHTPLSPSPAGGVESGDSP